METLELFGTRGPARVRERHAPRREKATPLAPVIDAVMARKPAEDHPPMPADGFSIPALPRAAAQRAGDDEFLARLETAADARASGRGYNPLLRPT